MDELRHAATVLAKTDWDELLQSQRHCCIERNGLFGGQAVGSNWTNCCAVSDPFVVRGVEDLSPSDVSDRATRLNGTVALFDHGPRPHGDSVALDQIASVSSLNAARTRRRGSGSTPSS
jgi:hypothetical protein